MIQPAGYSKNPLEKKLGFKEGMHVRLIHAPPFYFDLFENLPPNLEFFEGSANSMDFIHLFTKSARELSTLLPVLKKEIRPTGFIWVSWPKKSSGVPSDLDGNLIRKWALAAGLVDVKVCVVDETWSALKLRIPAKNR